MFAVFYLAVKLWSKTIMNMKILSVQFIKRLFSIILFCCFLQLHEVDVVVSDMLSPTEMNCEVACLLYDVTNPPSFILFYLFFYSYMK